MDNIFFMGLVWRARGAYLSGGDDVQEGAHAVEEHGHELDDERDAEDGHEEQGDGLQRQVLPLVVLAGQRDG